MKYHVIAPEYVSGYVIRLKFRDGTAGDIDFCWRSSRDLSSDRCGSWKHLNDLECIQSFTLSCGGQ